MTFVGSYTIDPKDYPFQKFYDEQKHLDTDELRHSIKPVIHLIDKDFKGEEHIFCDKEQRCPLGKYKRSKITAEAEQRGFTSGIEMAEADKKAEEDAKKTKAEQQQKEIDELREIVKNLIVSIKTKDTK